MGMTLAEKMAEFEDLSIKLQMLEDEIASEVMELQASQQVGRVKATYYPQGRGKWDWESCAKTLEPDDELIEKHTETKVTVKWNKIVDELDPDDEFKQNFYTPGTPFVSVSVK